MLFAKLLLSPMPHARVTRLDTSAALAMPGVKAILTADDLPGAAAGATLGEGVQATRAGRARPDQRAALQGEPILAVAAVDELTAAEAIEKIEIEFEPLPFVVDPIESLRPGGPNARTQGNVWMRPPAPPAAPGAARPGQRRAAGAGCRGAAHRRRRTGRCRRDRRRGAAPRRGAARRAAAGAARLQRRSGTRTGGGARRTWRAAPRGVRRRRRSRCGSGPTRTSPTRRRRPDADGQGDRRVDVRQHRGGLQEGRPRPRRNVRDASRPAISRSKRARRWPTGRTASCILHGSTQSTVQTVGVGRALGRHHAGQGRASSASTPAAASAARFRAPSRWRFRRCSRRKPTRR